LSPRAPARSPTGLRRALLAWYRRGRRDLPWRRTRDPYAVWVSEVMLQQTTVKVVLPYYTAFLERFPTLPALAGAREEDVLAAWSGLGYYERARNLHRGARMVVERHQGVFPRTLDAALALPGVGLYTAGAVLSIAYGVALPVVDGNVRRVLARLLALRGPAWLREGPYYNVAEELLAADAPGDWNQALMELGATVCTPRAPLCSACPARAHCAALAAGLVDTLPERRPRPQPVQVTVAAALVEHEGRVLLVRRPDARLMRGMWEVPQTSLEARGLSDLEPELATRHGLRVAAGPLLARVRHAITFRRIRVDVHSARLRRNVAVDAERFAWVRPQEVTLPVSSLTRKILKALERRQMPLALEPAPAPRAHRPARRPRP
jgi:A/G-specific adenine glycosylase